VFFFFFFWTKNYSNLTLTSKEEVEEKAVVNTIITSEASQELSVVETDAADIALVSDIVIDEVIIDESVTMTMSDPIHTMENQQVTNECVQETFKTKMEPYSMKQQSKQLEYKRNTIIMPSRSSSKENSLSCSPSRSRSLVDQTKYDSPTAQDPDANHSSSPLDESPPPSSPSQASGAVLSASNTNSPEALDRKHSSSPVDLSLPEGISLPKSVDPNFFLQKRLRTSFYELS